jgi:peptidoglycan L-alanyl-D-glutamate endopeptidase CwlK
MDAISEARLNLVHPILADKVRRMAAMLEGEKIAIRVVQGMRSWADQEALYQQGRTTKGQRVTNCPGGYSYHNFGLAVDCVPDEQWDDGKFVPDWNSAHPQWKRMEEVGESLGLENGADWRSFPDAPHFQLTGRFRVGSPPDEVRQIFKDGGMEAVWKATGITEFELAPAITPGFHGGVDA